MKRSLLLPIIGVSALILAVFLANKLVSSNKTPQRTVAIFRDNYKACFRFENEKVRSISVRNSIAEISEDQNNCDLIIRTSEKSLKLSLAGIKNPIGLIASGEIKVEGSEVNFLRFLSSFK